MVKILRYPTLITVDVIYYRPDYTNLLQEFIWQFEDHLPEHPRVNQFLFFWKENINAVIQQVLIAETNSNFRPVDLEKILGRL